MSNWPNAITTYIGDWLNTSRDMAYFCVNAEGAIGERGGSLGKYGLDALGDGANIEAHAPYLVGLIPSPGEPVLLESVQVGPERYADVHVIPGGSGAAGDWAVLIDCTSAVQLHQRIQQATNERALLRDQLAAQNRAIRTEQEKSESLLESILPKAIVGQLKAGQTKIAQTFDQASVLSAEVVDFSMMTRSMSPTQKVDLLNEVFTGFDDLARELGVEKIKTLGEVYEVAAGVPTAMVHHASALAEMALRMQQAVMEVEAGLDKPLRLRIAIGTGPVVAGVIGTWKFGYDVWGEIVNTTNALRVSAPPGSIQVTESAFALLREKFLLEERGAYFVKGEGEVITYLLQGRRM
ncbi:MAG: hypothetical protein GC162_11520 [Planctomycetes bacterium]|nr:hypothetical protein [Planctomycetota bacterium]